MNGVRKMVGTAQSRLCPPYASHASAQHAIQRRQTEDNGRCDQRTFVVPPETQCQHRRTFDREGQSRGGESPQVHTPHKPVHPNECRACESRGKIQVRIPTGAEQLKRVLRSQIESGGVVAGKSK